MVTARHTLTVIIRRISGYIDSANYANLTILGLDSKALYTLAVITARERARYMRYVYVTYSLH